jgi:hypothetical protein
MDMLLDKETNDLIFVNGLTPAAMAAVDVVAQRLSIRLLTFQSEYLFDTTYGVPYWQMIFGHKISKADVDLIYQQAILKEDRVKSITSFSSTLLNRVYSCTFTVQIDTDEITAPITITPTP